MESIIEFQELSTPTQVKCNKYKQKIIIEMLLKYSQLTKSDFASLLGISVPTLQGVSNNNEFLQGKPASNLIQVLFIFLGA